MRRRTPATFVSRAARYGGRGKGGYSFQRGMSLDHDVHDWLAGFPDESYTPIDVHDFLGNRGLILRNGIPIADEEVVPSSIFGRGCDQLVFRRP